MNIKIKNLKNISAAFLWRRIKTIPYLAQNIIDCYYFFNNKKQIFGDNNEVKINFQGSLPKLKNTIIKVYGDNNHISIGSGANISNTKIEVHGDCNSIVIEDNCKIKGGYLWVEDYNCKIKIGARTTSDAELRLHVSEPNSKITIGKDCMFAYGIIIRCADSHSIIDLDTNERINYAEDINIGDRVWIATRAQILKGVNIGNDSTVAAGAIVTKDVPNNSIVAGIPAQVKKTNVIWDRKKILNQ